MQSNNFYNFANEVYLKKVIPDDQSSLSNFSDITNRNTINMIKLFEKLKADSTANKLLKTLYDTKINFTNRTQEDQNDTCFKILNLCKEIDKTETLIDKICMLNDYGVSLFLSYGINENPSDEINDSYIINISTFKLSFDKDYYFNPKYKRELNGIQSYNRRIFKLLCERYPLYFKYTGSQIDEICSDFDYIETLLAPYVFSNVCKRDINERINIYKLKEIASIFKNIDLLNSCFLTKDYNLTKDEKPEVSIIFSNNISKCKKPETQINELVSDPLSEGVEPSILKGKIKDNTASVGLNNYSSLDVEEQKKHDNGEYYWHFLDDLFKNYQDNDPIRSKIDNYILWTIISSFMGLISEEIRQEKFKFFGTFLNGQQTEKPNEERAISYLMETLPELVGKLFCDTYFHEDHYKLMKQLVDYLIVAYENNFKFKCDWLKDKDSLNEALNKLNVLKHDNHLKIGYPKEETYTEKYNILFELFAKSDQNYSLFDYEIMFNKWLIKFDYVRYKRKTPDYTTWEMCAAITNAYYHPLKNEIVFPAGILQEPFFIFLSDKQLKEDGIDIYSNKYYSDILADRIRISESDPKYVSVKYITMASNFGSIGAIIGHEISHGFDDQGSKFDANGKMKVWWSKKVLEEYEKITDKIIKQFDEYSLELKIGNSVNIYHVNGKLTLGENIADLFGLTIAIDAFKNYYEDHKGSFKKTLNECMMELLISFGNTWRYIELPERTKGRINSDVHSPPIFRIEGTLKNTPIFYELFNVKKNEDIIRIFNE